MSTPPDLPDFPLSEVSGTWDRSGLAANIRLGDDVWIERPQTLQRFRSTRQPGLTVGDGCRIYGWSAFSIEATGEVRIGPGCVLVGAIFMCRELIELGRDVVVSYQVTIADSDFHPRDPQARRRDAEANAPYGDPATRPEVVNAPVHIGDGAWIGIGAIILKGVRIGAGARVQAGAVVSRDVPPGATAAGNPAAIASESP